MKIAGIDIGGTFIKGAVIEGEKIIYETKVQTNAAKGKQAVENALLGLADELLRYASEEAPIGIASAGDIDPKEGRVVYATDTLPGFTGLQLGKIVSEHTFRRVQVINDADAALLGEMEYGAAKGLRDAVLFTLGTGLGGGITVNGRLLIGNRFHAARPGHIPLYPGGRKCTCGALGCAEQYVSATGLIKNAKELGFETKDGAEGIMKAASKGDEKAARALGKFIADFTTVILTLQNILDPEVIVVGGGLIQMKEFWFDGLLKRLPQDVRGKVVPALLKNSAGCMGAAVAAEKSDLF